MGYVGTIELLCILLENLFPENLTSPYSALQLMS